MQVPDGMWYFGWQGDPPQPVALNPGDEIPDGVVVNLAPDDPLLSACMAADPESAAAALSIAQAPVAVRAVAMTAVVLALGPVVPRGRRGTPGE